MKDGHILIADFGFARLLPPSSIVLTNRGTPLMYSFVVMDSVAERLRSCCVA